MAKTLGDPLNSPPLPLPTFRSLTDLSLGEIRMVCIDREETTLNLSRPNPKCRRDWVLPLPAGGAHGPIEIQAYLPGGQYFMLLYKDGTIQLWDAFHQRRMSGISRHYVPEPVLVYPVPRMEDPFNLVYEIHRGARQELVTATLSGE